MIKSSHAVKLVGAFFVAFSVFVLYGVFTGNPLFTNTGQLAGLISATTQSTGQLQVFVVAGEDASLVTTSPLSDYPNLVSENTFKPSPSRQSSFSITRSGAVYVSGITDGVLVDQATSTGQILVEVPRLDGYEARGYLYSSAFAGSNEDVTSYLPLGFFSDQYGHYDGYTWLNPRIEGSTEMKYYFRFIVPANRLTRLVIFYQKQPVACQNIVMDLVEEKQPSGTILFRLLEPATTTAKDLSYLISPYSANSALISDYVLETRSLTSIIGSFNLESGRFTIVDNFSDFVGKTLPCGTLGDINNDGKITKDDVKAIDEMVAGNGIYTADQKARADVLGDGRVKNKDSFLVQQYLDGKTDTFPACGGGYSAAALITAVDPSSFLGSQTASSSGPLIERDSAIIHAVVPFNLSTRTVKVRENKVGGQVSTIPVGPFSATCPASCKLEFEAPDFTSGSGGCCAGLTATENDDGLICTKI